MLFSQFPNWMVFVFLVVSFFIKRKLLENLERLIESIHTDVLFNEKYIWSLFLLPVIGAYLSLFILTIFVPKSLALSLTLLELALGWILFSYRFTIQTKEVYAQLSKTIALVHIVFCFNVYVHL